MSVCLSVLDVILTPQYRLHHLCGLNPFEYQDGCLLFTVIRHSATYVPFNIKPKEKGVAQASHGNLTVRAVPKVGVLIFCHSCPLGAR